MSLFQGARTAKPPFVVPLVKSAGIPRDPLVEALIGFLKIENERSLIPLPPTKSAKEKTYKPDIANSVRKNVNTARTRFLV